MLIPAEDADFARLITGKSAVSSPEVLEMLRNLAAQLRPVFAPSAWQIRLHGETIGLCSIVREPVGATITIGYGIAPHHRGMGHCARAIALLLEWARSDARVHRVAAETGTANLPSQRVLERNGFCPVGLRIDAEDGELICWHCETA